MLLCMSVKKLSLPVTLFRENPKYDVRVYVIFSSYLLEDIVCVSMCRKCMFVHA